MRRNYANHPCKTALNIHDFNPEKVDFLRNKEMVQIGRQIGDGSSSYIYKCTFKLPRGNPIPCTAKISRILIDKKEINISTEGKITVVLNATTGGISDYSTWKRSFDDFNREYVIGEYVQDPPSLRKLDEYRHRVHGGMQITQPVDGKTKEIIEQEKAEMQRHPGFQHLLQLFHFIPEIPCIIAEECDGDSFQLFRNNGKLSEEYTSQIYITHVTLGMLYLYQVCAIANTDLKFENVLFKNGAGGRYRFIVSDYGGCNYAEKEFIYGGNTITIPYVHHSVWKWGTVTNISISVFNLLVMIFQILLKRYLLHHGDRNDHWFNMTCSQIFANRFIQNSIDKLSPHNPLQQIRKVIQEMPSIGYSLPELITILDHLKVCDYYQIKQTYNHHWLNHYNEIRDYELAKTVHDFTPIIQHPHIKLLPVQQNNLESSPKEQYKHQLLPIEQHYHEHPPIEQYNHQLLPIEHYHEHPTRQPPPIAYRAPLPRKQNGVCVCS